MSFDVVKTSTINCLAELQTAINADVAIVTVCEAVRLDLPNSMTIGFAGAGPLSGAEDIALDSLLGSFACTPSVDNVGPNEVDPATITVGDILVFNGTNWIPEPQIVVGTPRFFDVYDNTGGQVFSDLASIIVNLDAVRADSGSSAFTLATDEVTINNTGTYEIEFRVAATQSVATRLTIRAWLELNSVEVDGSQSRGYLRNLVQGSTVTTTVIMNLTAGDVLRIGAESDTAGGSGITVVDGSSLTISTIGANGTPGIDGAGGTMPEFNSIESLAQSTTTSSILQQKLRLSVNVPNGTYILFWSATGGNSGEERGFRFQVQLDDTTDLTDGTARQTEGNSGEWLEPKGGHAVLALNGAHNIDMDFAAAGGTARIRDARLTLWRVT